MSRARDKMPGQSAGKEGETPTEIGIKWNRTCILKQQQSPNRAGKPAVSGSVRINPASVVLGRLFLRVLLCGGFRILPGLLIRRACIISRMLFLFGKRICFYHRLYLKGVIRHKLLKEIAIHFFMVIQIVGNLVQLILMLL